MTADEKRWRNEVRRIEAFLLHERLIPDDGGLLMAVSGGVDSMTLLQVLRDLAPRHGWTLALGHVNHGLRGEESDGDEELVRRTAEAYGLAFRSARWPGHREGNLHDAARAYRYERFEDWAEELNCQVVVTAHHADDQAETVLDRLARGAGLRGLCALRERNGKVVRPLIRTTRETILRMASWRDIAYREDSSNRSYHYTRNRLRHEVLPLLESIRPGAAKHLADLAFLAQATQNELEAWTDRDEAATCTKDETRVTVAVGALAELSAIRRYNLWRRIHERLVGESLPSLANVMDLDGALLNQNGTSTLPFGSGLFVERMGTHVVFSTTRRLPTETLRLEPGIPVTLEGWSVTWNEVGEDFDSTSLSFPSGQNDETKTRLCEEGTEWFDRDVISGALVLRSARPGDRLFMDGVGHRAVSDVLREGGIPRGWRQRHPVVVDKDGILSVVGLRRSSRGLISRNTKKLGAIRWKKDAPFG